MNRADLYQLALATAKANQNNQNAIDLALAIDTAAKTGGIDPADFAIFQNYCRQMLATFKTLGSPLPSEQVAKVAAGRANAASASGRVAPATNPAPAVTPSPATAK